MGAELKIKLFHLSLKFAYYMGCKAIALQNINRKKKCKCPHFAVSFQT